MAAGDPILYSLYIYAPNRGAPIFFAVAFAISAVFHIWQCWRYKALRMIGLHSVCAVFFTLGFIFREYASYHYIYTATEGPPLIIFILSQVFIYICPPLLELSNYHILGRIFYYVPHCAPIPASRVLITFGGLMALVETLNAVGAALSANPSASPSQQSLASNLIIAVLVIQLGVILIFICLAAIFHTRCTRAAVQTKAVNTLLITLYTSMTLIFIRCIYRLVEHTGNTKIDIADIEALRRLSPLLRYEVFFYIFEATLMLLNSVLWNVWNPGRFLPKNIHTYLAQDGSEATVEEIPDNRSHLAKIANVVTFGILCRRKTTTVRFEELSEYDRNEPASTHITK
ncbi:hypothetical protein TrVFT333_006690 [Trichoderma virens FT-333]|nr:hypothetical protein TrVFT333_006690 [Trichoderma virens FT-333]